MIFSVSYLQFGNNLVNLVEWFIASIAFIVVVTLIYVFVLNKSPPPEGFTQAKLEISSVSTDQGSNISAARDALKNADYRKAVELSVKAVRGSLAMLLSGSGVNLSSLNVSDMAFLVQSKAKSPDITQPIYQLNMLNLKAAQSQSITIQEAEWAVNTSDWLAQLVSTQQIRF